MSSRTDDLRVRTVRPLLPPAILAEEIPASAACVRTVSDARSAISDIVHGRDPRLLVVVGPCSIHDPDAALEYASRLRRLAAELAASLLVVMRTYFEKPRTTVGWKGLVNDPDLDGRFRINRGLRLARGLLRDLAEMGMPAGVEFLDPISPQFVADLVSWGAIGARTTESQVHREMASGLSMPVGFKNGTDGGIQVAVDAVCSASHPHHFLGVTKDGLSAIVATEGNPDCLVILRGGKDGPNFGPRHVASVLERLSACSHDARVMIDASHGNSGKDHTKQAAVVESVAARVAEGDHSVLGVMLESFLVAGRQSLEHGTPLTRGQSVTDACIGWEETEELLSRLADAVQATYHAEPEEVASVA
jgi:3-deoxy-7-phosphoheptulonate synthase